MAVLIQAELDKLKKSLLTLSAEVEEQVQKAVQALLTCDRTLADSVRKSDDKIDLMEVELEEECLKVLALHQPVAQDLRFIVSVLKINNDLERVADFACNIAERAIDLCKIMCGESPYNVAKMADKVKEMLRKALDALMTTDSALARKVILMDDSVDTMHRENFTTIKLAIQDDPQTANVLLYYLSISRYLERMGDLATNIAEDVVYQIEGEIIRHRGVDNPRS